MSPTDVLDRIRTHLNEEAESPVERIPPATSFRDDLETDSLYLLTLMNDPNDRLGGARVSDEELVAIQTVGEAIDLVLRHNQAAAG